jgi:hypothetical protein
VAQLAAVANRTDPRFARAWPGLHWRRGLSGWCRVGVLLSHVLRGGYDWWVPGTASPRTVGVVRWEVGWET